MSVEKVDVLIVGGGQAGLAMSEHLSNNGVAHVILERDRIAERWRDARWDSLVANGPAWHDSFPTMDIGGVGADDFASKHDMVRYFEEFAEQIKAPIRCGVAVTEVTKTADGEFLVDTSAGMFAAKNIVVATGPFQTPLIPPVIVDNPELLQMHSCNYYNPQQMPEGAVMVVGAGSSGTQIAEELLKSGRDVYLSVGPHDRPPRRYRGKDFVWWLGVLGKWEIKTPDPKTAHVTIAVSGAYGGKTIDFRRLANDGMMLVGMTQKFENGVLTFAEDLANNIALGDKNHLSLLREADEYIAKNNLDFPAEPDAHNIMADPLCVAEPILELNLARANVTSIIWATGYSLNFNWLKLDIFDESGKPRHHRGVSVEAGIYFIGLPWLSMRGSAFIWGAWKDAKYLAEHIVAKNP